MISWGVETLLATSLLMLAILLLRNPVRRAFGPSVAYALWALPVLRLILPPLPGDWRLSGLVSPAVEKAMGQGVAFGVLNPERLPASVADQAIATVDLTLAAEPIRMVLVPPVAAAGGPSWLLLALILWAIGAAIFLAYHLVTYRRFCRRLESQTRRRHRIAGDRVEVIETDATGGPLAFGIWRKVVAFPSDFTDRYDEDERTLALAHELAHHARGDLVANWVALGVLALHWFNPIAWRAFRAFRADQEMACDARVLAGRTAAFTHAYGRAIVKSAHGGAISAACHLHTINDLKGRLRMLSSTKKSRGRLVAGSMAVIAVGIAGLGLTASGTQAAENVRTKVNEAIGGDLAELDRLAASNVRHALAPLPSPAAQATGAAPVPPAAPLAPLQPQSVPVPPSDVAPAAPPAPVAPVAPVAPAAGDTDSERQEWTDADGKRHIIVFKKRRSKKSEADLLADGFTAEELAQSKRDGAPIIHRMFKFGGPGVKVRTDDGNRMTIEIRQFPEVTQMNCGRGQGDDRKMVLHDEKNGKRRIIICQNRIDKVTVESAAVAANSRNIERKAYQSALEGLRSTRASIAAKGKPSSEALQAIDEAIAEVEADLAKVN
ncbi:MAG: M56 family metallopeptidase [Sphingomonas sp.]|uniref:M56 family metallopeptidase n=1 Tax=Sphingomonas sp. TaxID=28214 RepID=UPI0035A85C40|nr:M56 family metallopeptidase [Sphingomonas sp.]